MSRPPNVKPAARAGAAGDGAKARNDGKKPTATVRTIQGGTSAKRYAGQPAPTWPEPPGTRAVRQLEALWGNPRDPRRRGRS